MPSVVAVLLLLAASSVAALSVDDLSVLARRIELAKQTKPLKALVMSEHYLVPRQRLRMNIMPTAPVLPMLRELHRCGGSLAMLGIDQNLSSVVGRPQLMRFGVEASVESIRTRPDDKVDVCLLGGRVFEFVEVVAPEGDEAAAKPREPSQYMTVRGRAIDLNEADAFEAKSSPDKTSRKLELASREIAPLVECWMDLVQSTQQERSPGHLDEILEELGPLPPVTDYSERAMWAAALINAHPSLGRAGATWPVADEVRPSVLLADSAMQRLALVKNGLVQSITRLARFKRGRPPI